MKGIKKICYLLILGMSSTLMSQTTLAQLVREEPDILAEGAVLIEPKTNTILYEKNAHEALYPASITKILTALIVADELDDQAMITKSEESVTNVPCDSSEIGLKIGDTYSKKEGLYGLLLASDNFIAYDLACKTAGDIPSFTKKMNEKARQLGAYESNFVNPHGYHDEAHYTTAYDMAQIARGAFENETVAEIAGTVQHDFYIQSKGVNIPIRNSSRLLKRETPYFNPHVTSCKTGFHDDAKQTLVAKAVYDNIELIAVAMKDNTPSQYEDVNKLFKYGRENFSLREVDGAYILDNHSISMEAQDAVNDFEKKGWIDIRADFQKPIQVKELKPILKKIGFQQPEFYVDEIVNVLELDEEDYVTQSQLATMMRFLEDKWYLAQIKIDTSLVEKELVSCETTEIQLEQVVQVLDDMILK